MQDLQLKLMQEKIWSFSILIIHCFKLKLEQKTIICSRFAKFLSLKVPVSQWKKHHYIVYLKYKKIILYVSSLTFALFSKQYHFKSGKNPNIWQYLPRYTKASCSALKTYKKIGSGCKKKCFKWAWADIFNNILKFVVLHLRKVFQRDAFTSVLTWTDLAQLIEEMGMSKRGKYYFLTRSVCATK